MYGVVLHAHPVRGESHNQRNTTGEVATLASVQLQNFTNFCFLYVYYALVFSSSIEMWNKVNSFTHLIVYTPFVVAIFMGPFLKVCLGPLPFNIHHGQAIPESVCNGSVNTRAALSNWKASWYLRKILLPIRLVADNYSKVFAVE